MNNHNFIWWHILHLGPWMEGRYCARYRHCNFCLVSVLTNFSFKINEQLWTVMVSPVRGIEGSRTPRIPWPENSKRWIAHTTVITAFVIRPLLFLARHFCSLLLLLLVLPTPAHCSLLLLAAPPPYYASACCIPVSVCGCVSLQFIFTKIKFIWNFVYEEKWNDKVYACKH